MPPRLPMHVIANVDLIRQNPNGASDHDRSCAEFLKSSFVLPNLKDLVPLPSGVLGFR
jgi:hypothetical protein